MFRALKSQNISLQIILPILALIPIILVFFLPELPLNAGHNAQGWFYGITNRGWLDAPVLMSIFAYIPLILISTWLFWFNIRFEIIGERTISNSFFYLVLCLTPINLHFFHPGLLAAVLIFIGFNIVFGLYEKPKAMAAIFNSGFVFGLAILVYPPSVFFFPIFIVAIGVMKSVEPKDIVSLLIGIIGPIWLWIGWLILKGELGYEWAGFKQWFEVRSSWPPFIGTNRTLIIVWLSWILMYLVLSVRLYRSRKDVGRRILSALFQFVWMGPAIFLIFEKVSIEIWWFMALPVSMLFSLAVFNARRNIYGNFLILSLVVFLVLSHLLPFLA